MPGIDKVIGYGRIIITSSDATQFAFEGDHVIVQADNSLLTNFLIKGLEGEADLDGDGLITVDELYDYAYEQIVKLAPYQKPSKLSSKQQGSIVLRQITRIEDIKPLPLPAEILDEIKDSRPYVREAAVQKLEKLFKGKNLGLARSARWALEKIIVEDDSRRVVDIAKWVIESVGHVVSNRTMKQLKVFLCHSSNDKPTVRDLYQKLSSENWLDIWLDEEKLLPGQDWEYEIESALDKTDAVLVTLSRGSVTKEGYVQRELRFVIDIALEKPEGTIFILPVRLEECEAPRKLRTYHYADYFPAELRERAYQRLLASLRRRAQELGIPVIDQT